MNPKVSRLQVWAGRVALSALVAWTAACASAPVRGPARFEVGDAQLLVDPRTGFPDEVQLSDGEQLAALHRLLLEGRTGEAAEPLGRLAAVAPLSAAVLQAELEIVEGRPEGARDRLLPVVAVYPGYSAAQAVLGLAAERLGEIVDAYGAYEAAGLPVTAARNEILRPRVLEVLDRRIGSGLAGGDLAAAQRALERLEAWAPGLPTTLQRQWDVARATGDGRKELTAVRGLAAGDPSDEELQRSLAALELDWGDPGAALRLYESLARAHPEEGELTASVRRARQPFRLSLVPPQVRQLADREALDRGEFAALLYWMVPAVRTSRGVGRIASDVLDHPRRREIVRVVNLGILDVDDARHTFSPERPLTQHEARLAALRVLALQGEDCVSGRSVSGPLPVSLACDLALACGLEAAGGCAAQAAVPGSLAIEFSRRLARPAGDG